MHKSATNGSTSGTAASRPSPRWRDPLVDEFPPPPNESLHQNGRTRHRSEHHGQQNGQQNAAANGWSGEERPFFSPEFYRAFPHLRPMTSKASWLHSTPPPSRMADDEEEFTSHLDRFDRNWRDDPFWRDLYPRWAEPIFKSGIDVQTNISNDSRRFAVEIDTYQFRPEELQVKTMDDTLLIEGRHEDVRDRDNYTKMQFIRKYQLPSDVEPHTISSHIDGRGRLVVEAQKRASAIDGYERAIPIESGAGRRYGSRSSSYSPRDRLFDSGRGSAQDYYRTESRLNGAGAGGYLSAASPKSEGYRTEFESRKTDGNGMRHEAHREEFREEVRRTGSAANVLPVAPSPVPVYRTESRLSGAGGERRSESHFHRSSSSSRNEFRGYSNGAGTEHLLRPAEELGGRSSAFGTRSVPIQRA